MSKNWIPSASDIAWTRALIDRINDGGMWIVPANNSGYRINKLRKTVVMEFGIQDDLHARICSVLTLLGYDVIVNNSASISSLEDHM